MTYQTTEPVREISMNITGRTWGDLIHQLQKGDISRPVRDHQRARDGREALSRVWLPPLRPVGLRVQQRGLPLQ